jgi:hypothetical protein
VNACERGSSRGQGSPTAAARRGGRQRGFVVGRGGVPSERPAACRAGKGGGHSRGFPTVTRGDSSGKQERPAAANAGKGGGAGAGEGGGQTRGGR